MPDCTYISRLSVVSALEGKSYDVRIVSDVERNGLNNKMSNTQDPKDLVNFRPSSSLYW